MRLRWLKERTPRLHQVDEQKDSIYNMVSFNEIRFGTTTSRHSKSAIWIVLSQAAKRGKEQNFDVVLCDTSGRKYRKTF